VTKVAALSRSIYRLQSAREYAQLESRRIDSVLPTLCFPDRKWNRRVGNYLHRRKAYLHTQHDGVDNIVEDTSLPLMSMGT
jgi:hypothetical protein